MSVADVRIAAFLKAQAGFEQPFSPGSALSGRGIWRWQGSETLVPGRMRTGPKNLGLPTSRKKFRRIEFHGKGSYYARAWVDGELVVTGAEGSFVENPDKMRIVPLPRGTKGYTIDVEIIFFGQLRGIEVEWDLMPQDEIERHGGMI